MKTKLSDYTPTEIERYTLMHVVLAAYNANYGTNDEISQPKYSDEEKGEMGIFFELILEEKAKRIT
jgi:hypothetical protein